MFRAVCGWFCGGELEADIVLMRLLCCALLPFSLLPNAAAVGGFMLLENVALNSATYIWIYSINEYDEIIITPLC